MMNSEQVKALFAHEAVLLGSKDGVPFYRTAEIFGEDAAEYAKRCGRKNNGARMADYYNAFGVGDYICGYLTYKGFCCAAAYANVLEIREREVKKPETKCLTLVLNQGQSRKHTR